MRTACVTSIGIGLALALVPGRASADPPHVEMRLEYVRGSGGETCPAEPATLRAEVAARMGYDPFETANAPERLAVVMVAKDRGFAARVERFDAAGVSTWSATFPTRALKGDCAAVMSPLASYLRGMFLSYESGPAAPPATPPPEPALPLPKPPEPASAPAPPRCALRRLNLRSRPGRQACPTPHAPRRAPRRSLPSLRPQLSPAWVSCGQRSRERRTTTRKC